jgi:hypothetical protein
MASFKSHPFFYTSLLLIGAVAAGEAWLLFSQRSEVSKLETEIVTKLQDLDGFARQNPFPSAENVKLVDADLAEAEKTRAEIRGILRATSETAGKLAAAVVPGSSLDAYFDIANYAERVRDSALRAGVTAPADNRFGFSLYASTGPEVDLIEPVFRQRQYADYLMEVLIAARPREFVSLQRERPLSPAQKQQISDALASGQQAPSFGPADGGDFFNIDSRVSARVPGFVETTPFRLVFVGTTASLRSMLNKLALFELPVVVRSVEVEALNKGESRSSQPSAPSSPFSLFGGDTASTPQEQEKPIVEQTDSRFIVTVEFIGLVEATKPADTANP